LHICISLPIRATFPAQLFPPSYNKTSLINLKRKFRSLNNAA
jgi:hypothetical protein